jgi:hypothetical protein
LAVRDKENVMQIKTVALIALITTAIALLFSFIEFAFYLKRFMNYGTSMEMTLILFRWITSLGSQAAIALFFGVLYSKQK